MTFLYPFFLLLLLLLFLVVVVIVKGVSVFFIVFLILHCVDQVNRGDLCPLHLHRLHGGRVQGHLQGLSEALHDTGQQSIPSVQLIYIIQPWQCPIQMIGLCGF